MARDVGGWSGLLRKMCAFGPSLLFSLPAETSKMELECSSTCILSLHLHPIPPSPLFLSFFFFCFFRFFRSPPSFFLTCLFLFFKYKVYTPWLLPAFLSCRSISRPHFFSLSVHFHLPAAKRADKRKDLKKKRVELFLLCVAAYKRTSEKKKKRK